MSTNPIGKIAIAWRGDAEARAGATAQNTRLKRIFEELAVRDIAAEPAVFAEEFADAFRSQLKRVDGVLVWIDPLSNGRDRSVLDPLLRDVAARGTWVSGHPDVILKMGVKEVLYRTRHLGWGTGTYLYASVDALRAQFPRRVALGTRVLKQNRGNGGQGVWRVQLAHDAGKAPLARVLEARRDAAEELLPLDAFIARCETYFARGGCLVDQPFQERLGDGMIRCYMSGAAVVGYGHQLIKALLAPTAEPGPRIMHGPDAAPFQALRHKMETEWVPQMQRVLDIATDELPAIWDADFLYGPKTADGADTYVLCEINASSCFPVPEEAPARIAQCVAARLGRGR